jgi:hypothetical protein
LPAQHRTDEANSVAREILAVAHGGADGTQMEDLAFGDALHTVARVTAGSTRPAEAIPLYQSALRLLRQLPDTRRTVGCGVELEALLERCERPGAALEVTEDLLRSFPDESLPADLRAEVLWQTRPSSGHERSLARRGADR